jgi:hypothetical protein
MSNKRRCDSRLEQFWRETLAAREKSGQSVRDFCASRQLSEASFSAGRYRSLGPRMSTQMRHDPRLRLTSP